MVAWLALSVCATAAVALAAATALAAAGAWLVSTFGRPAVGKGRRRGGAAVARPRSSGLSRGRSLAELEELERLWTGPQHGRREDEAGGVWADVIELRAERPAKGRAVTFVMVPGNPGEPDFYTAMLEELYERSGRSVSVVCVGHAGHSRGCRNGGRVFDLDAQVRHKLRFVERLLEREPDARLVLAGHSVGAHICLRVMDLLGERRVDRHVVRACMLFPTIMRIGSTPNGVRLTPLFRAVPRLALAAVSGALSLLPEAARRAVVRLNVGADHPEVVEAALHICDFWVTLNALYMAGTEMRDIRGVEDAHGRVLARHLDRLDFYYGADDGWVPLEQMDEMRRKYPEGRYRLCQDGLRHAFVIGGSHHMGRVCWEWTREAMRQHA